MLFLLSVESCASLRPRPARPPSLAGPFAHCRPRDLTCQDFGTAYECGHFAPPAYCTWNGTSCEFISSWTCPDGQASCSQEQAVNYTTNPFVPQAAVDAWPTHAKMSGASPDILTFSKPVATNAWSKNPLWREAVTENCSCLTDPSCKVPISGEPVPGSGVFVNFTYSCSRTETLFSATVSLLYNAAWDTYGFPRPLANASSSNFTTIGEGFRRAFLNDVQHDVEYERYFNMCAPNHCTYTTVEPQSLLSGITTTISLVGGFVVAIRYVWQRVAAST